MKSFIFRVKSYPERKMLGVLKPDTADVLADTRLTTALKRFAWHAAILQPKKSWMRSSSICLAPIRQ